MEVVHLVFKNESQTVILILFCKQITISADDSTLESRALDDEQIFK